MYVDAFFKKGGDTEIIRVVERVDGKRVYREYAPDYHFFINDPNGKLNSIYGDKVSKVTPRSYGERYRMLKKLPADVKTWETDIDPVFRCLEQEYHGVERPKLHNAFFDIETAFDADKGGWSKPEDATNSITAISIHRQWLNQTVCFAMPPDNLTWEEANEISSKIPGAVLFTDEAEMLNTFIEFISDADVISGWNSESYDIPYIVNRILRIMGEDAVLPLCLWGQKPKMREYDRGGKIEKTYDTIGRVHLDYLQLYKKYTYEERQSYKLDSIAEYELNEHKVEYEGTLDELYRFDFNKFLEYSIQDTNLLDKLDKKLQFIDLACNIAHANRVLLQTTMGTVAMTDQALIMEAHTKNMVVQNKSPYIDDKDEKEANQLANRAAGGWVATPKKGLHKWVASVDLNSLYPSVLRAFNMSPETIVGQIRLTETNEAIKAWEKAAKKNTFAGWWNDRYNVLEMEYVYACDTEHKLLVDMEGGETYEMTGSEIHQLVFESSNNWCISANGSIFRTDIEGIIPSLLARWYRERKELQKRKTEFETVIAGYRVSSPNTIHSSRVSDLTVVKLRAFNPTKLDVTNQTQLLEHGVEIIDGMLKPMKEYLWIWKEVLGFFDKQQAVRKIGLNSAFFIQAPSSSDAC